MGSLEEMPPADLVAYAQEIERLGYRGLRVGENLGREPFAALAYVAANYVASPLRARLRRGTRSAPSRATASSTRSSPRATPAASGRGSTGYT
jgi:hypothetical protein